MRPIHQRGQVYPLFGIMLTVIVGTSALSVDVGYYRYQQRVQQAATDSAAIAAGQASFYDSSNASNPQNAARADATKNGFTDGSGTVTVVAAAYTDAGNCPASAGCIGVTITKSYPIFFGSIFKGFGSNNDQKKIRTFAAAKLAAVGGSCLTSLGNTTASSTSNGGITGPNCGIADADCSVVNGGGNMTIQSFTVNAACGSSNKWNGSTSQFVNSIPPVDPCSVDQYCQKLINATASQLGISSKTLTTATCTVSLTVGASPVAPGCYKNQTFKNKTLAGGLYVLLGTTKFNGTITANSGVTLYFGPGAQWGTDKSTDSVTLSAPTSGDFNGYSTYSSGEQGVLMYQTPGSTWTQTLNDNANWTGLIYMPNWQITFAGHDKTFTGNLAVNSFKFNGANVNLLPGDGTSQGAPQQVVLAE